MKRLSQKGVKAIIDAYKALQSSDFIPNIITMPVNNVRKFCKAAGLTPEETEQFILDHTISFEDE